MVGPSLYRVVREDVKQLASHKKNIKTWGFRLTDQMNEYISLTRARSKLVPSNLELQKHH